jgi:hypothetical protein
MVRRFWWLDSKDFALAIRLVNSVREKQLSDWDWVSWREEYFAAEDKKEAFLSLAREISLPPMFAPGKVVYCHGLPTFHAKLAGELKSIPEGVLFILLARIDRTLTLYTRAEALRAEAPEEKDSKVKFDWAFDLTKETSTEYVKKRATAMGLRIDEACCKSLVDFSGLSHDKITNELRKLKYYCEDGVVSRDAIAQVNFESGAANLQDLTRYVFARNDVAAHELIERVLSREPVLRVLGLLVRWARVFMIGRSCGCDLDPVREDVAALRALKPKKKGKAPEDGEPGEEDEEEAKPGPEEAKPEEEAKARDGEKPETVPMFPKPQGLCFSFKDLREAQCQEGWPYLVASKVMDLQIFVRKHGTLGEKGLVAKEFHRFLDGIIKASKDAPLKG